jgi:hypothetical protein
VVFYVVVVGVVVGVVVWVGYVNTRITPRLADVTIAETPPRSARKSKIKSSAKKIF